jgi:hypothetical protein
MAEHLVGHADAAEPGGHTNPPPTHSPTPPKDLGPTHGHKGKGHDK